MAVATAHAGALAPAHTRALPDLLRELARHLPLVAVVALVVGVHIPTLDSYFYGDDFLVPGDVNSRSFPDYVRDVVLLRDMTPNWRPLTMLVYYGEFHLFGLDALPWRIVNLSVHAANVVLLYALVMGITRRVFAATAAALIFGISASAVHTVTYVTAFPHILSEFFLLSSLLALHRYVESGERRALWYWASLLMFVGGFLANEGGVVMGVPLFAYFALASLAKRRDVLDFMLKMAPFAMAAIMLVGSLGGCGCQGVDRGFYGLGWHIPRATWVYMSRLAYPVGAIPLDPTALEWAIGSVVAGAALFFLVRGPNIARVAALGMVAALMPYAPGKIWTATRYTYMALPFFAILVAMAAAFVHGHASRLSRPAAHALAALALAAVGGLYGWQTLHQSQPFLRETQRWELLVTELEATYDEVPPGTTVYIIDDEGMWTNAYWQPTWLASVGRALYGEDVRIRAVPAEFFLDAAARDGRPARYIVKYDDGRMYRVLPETATQRVE